MAFLCSPSSILLWHSFHSINCAAFQVVNLQIVIFRSINSTIIVFFFNRCLILKSNQHMSVFFSLHPIWIVIQYLLDFYLSGWWLLVVSCIVCMLWFVYKTWNILFRIDQYRNWLHWVGFFACLSHAIAYFPSSNCKQFECCMACYFWGVNKRFMHCRNIPTFSVFSCTKAFPSDWNVSENFYIHIHTD